MATIHADIYREKTFGNDAIVYTWALLTTTNNYGNPQRMPGSADRSIQITGDLGTGGAVTMYGSNVIVLDGSGNLIAPNEATDADWFILRDAGYLPLVLTTLTGEEIVTLPLWIRPKLSAGNGSTSLTARLVMKGNLP